MVTDNFFLIVCQTFWYFYKNSRRVFLPKIEIFGDEKTRQNAHNAFNSMYTNKKSMNKIPFCKSSRRTC